jgi:hypothetical protein
MFLFVLMLSLNPYNNFNFENGLKSYSEDINIKEELGSQWLDFGHINTYFK